MAGTIAPEPGSVSTASDRGTGRGDSPRPSSSSQFGNPVGMIVKLVLVALLNAVVIWGILRMLDRDKLSWAVIAAVALVLLDLIYVPNFRFVPGKYLYPGVALLLLFAVYPVLYTVYISFTNYGTGNNISKEQAISIIERNSITSGADAVRYDLQILAEGDPTGDLAFLLQDPDTEEWFLGTAESFDPVPADQIVEQGIRSTVDGYVALNAGQAQDRAAEIAAFEVIDDNGDIIKNNGFGEAFVQEQVLQYDADRGVMVNTQTGVEYLDQEGAFVSAEGQRLDPGWQTVIGFDNYKKLFTDPAINEPFVRVFIWTFIFAILSVILTFFLGLFMAITFNNDRMKGRKISRSLLIVPYAVPSFMTILVWQGMFNQTYGVINRWLGLDWPWLDGLRGWEAILPYISILIVNLWLGYPYMFLITLGALQGIPSDLSEAAYVDGATGWKTFKRVVFPLLLIAVAPLLISSFAFNFNNFNAIELLTGGGPIGPAQSAGRTDILISYTYRLAFGSARGADYGLASAVSVIIFFIVATISTFSFRFTKTFEEVR
jgi:arabinogalactan oligomer / maltooligosaccharide transport system permease protein